MNTNRKRVAAGAALVVALAMGTGCAHYIASGITGSTSPMVGPGGTPQSYTVLGHETGVSKRTYLFGFIRWGKNLVNEAIQDAVSKHNGDAMINVTVDTKTTGWFFGTTRSGRSWRGMSSSSSDRPPRRDPDSRGLSGMTGVGAHAWHHSGRRRRRFRANVDRRSHRAVSMRSYGYPHYIRINVGLPAENERFVAALGRVLKLT